MLSSMVNLPKLVWYVLGYLEIIKEFPINIKMCPKYFRTEQEEEHTKKFPFQLFRKAEVWISLEVT